jgi:hypothetical protein
MSYPTADFEWNHNAKWDQIINDVRNVFKAAGKNIILTIDNCGWFDDSGLGYNAVKYLNSSEATVNASDQGISGATFLANLDFISFSNWLPLILQSQEKTTWNDSDVSWLINCWFANPNFYKTGVYPYVIGRNIFDDCRALSKVMTSTYDPNGTLVLMNTGWESSHGFLYHSPNRVANATVDLEEQKVAWAAQLGALADPRSQWQSWCAGQDFERYVEDKATDPTDLSTSWRNAPAQAVIIDGIDKILNETS